MDAEKELWINAIHSGPILEVMPLMPSESVHCIITSPPYYSQRDYCVPGQIGNENSPAEYVQHLQEAFSQCRRVLKENGTLWLNMADKYHNGELLGLPWRVALALKDDGWILRSGFC